jgi:hypothetical protein
LPCLHFHIPRYTVALMVLRMKKELMKNYNCHKHCCNRWIYPHITLLSLPKLPHSSSPTTAPYPALKNLFSWKCHRIEWVITAATHIRKVPGLNPSMDHGFTETFRDFLQTPQASGWAPKPLPPKP